MLRFMLEQEDVSFYEPRYNVAPGQLIPAIIHDGVRNKLGQLRWGLIPPWAKDEKIGYRLINARSETAADKPAFRKPLARRRCLIPADGFYEWKTDGKQKQPMRITLKSGELFGLAGLYEIWENPQGEKIASCAILTTRPNALMADIHDRMPVLLKREDEAVWLDRGEHDEARLLSLIETPYPADDMTAYPVDKAVGNVRHDTPELIKQI